MLRPQWFAALGLCAAQAGCWDMASTPNDAGAAVTGSDGGAGAAGAGAGVAGGAGMADAGAGGVSGVAIAMEGARLSEAGLYSNFAARVVATRLRSYAPSHELWSDGALKARWIELPAGTTIDTSDMDGWQFPVGTRFFKEFSAPDGRRLETRMIQRIGDGPDDYTFGSYVWASNQGEAYYTERGASNVSGTSHDVPKRSECLDCHQGAAGRILGFSAVQLAQTKGPVTLELLAAQSWLTTAPPADIAPPGDATTQAALGYFHANCGHCHNPQGLAAATGLFLDLRSNDRSVFDTGVYSTAIGQPLAEFSYPGYTTRIVPGVPAQTEILFRMGQRGKETASMPVAFSPNQMPPLGTEYVDPTGLDTVTRFVLGLPAQYGGPPALGSSPPSNAGEGGAPGLAGGPPWARAQALDLTASSAGMAGATTGPDEAFVVCTHGGLLGRLRQWSPFPRVRHWLVLVGWTM
jgi:hypothetical protein